MKIFLLCISLMLASLAAGSMARDAGADASGSAAKTDRLPLAAATRSGRSATEVRTDPLFATTTLELQRDTPAVAKLARSPVVPQVE